MVCVLEALIRSRHVWETWQHRYIVGINAISPKVVGREVTQTEQVFENVTITAGDGPERYVDHVVGQPATIGESGEVTGHSSKAVRLRAGRDGCIQPQHLRCHDSDGLIQGRDSGQEYRHQVVASRRGDRRDDTVIQ